MFTTTSPTNSRNGAPAQRTRSKLYRLLELPKSSRGARVLSRVVMVLVLLSIMGFTVETMIEIVSGHVLWWVRVRASCHECAWVW